MKTIFYRAVLVLGTVALFLDGWALLDFLFHPLAGDNTFNSALYRAATILIPLPLTLLVAFLVIRRVPGNIVGPLLIVWSGTVAYNSVRVELGSLAFGLFYGYNLVFGWLAFFLLILHFPDGKVYPPVAAAWIYRILCISLPFNSMAFLIQEVYDIPDRMANAFYIPALYTYTDLVQILGLLFFTPLLLLDLIAPVLRYRNGSLLERQQIKWLALFGGSTTLYTIIGLIIFPLVSRTSIMSPGTGPLAVIFYFTTGLFPPMAIGFAVLRYRLWDIDRIIRRTLVYSILTVIMTLIYFGSVVVLQTLFSLVLKLNTNDLAVVLSTLSIAVLFSPLRRRVQSAIDRRFFRRKYDADQILASFAATARGVVTLEPLVDAVLQNIEDTLQPDRMSLWIKTPRDPL